MLSLMRYLLLASMFILFNLGFSSFLVTADSQLKTLTESTRPTRNSDKQDYEISNSTLNSIDLQTFTIIFYFDLRIIEFQYEFLENAIADDCRLYRSEIQFNQGPNFKHFYFFRGGCNYNETPQLSFPYIDGRGEARAGVEYGNFTLSGNFISFFISLNQGELVDYINSEDIDFVSIQASITLRLQNPGGFFDLIASDGVYFENTNIEKLPRWSYEQNSDFSFYYFNFLVPVIVYRFKRK